MGPPQQASPKRAELSPAPGAHRESERRGREAAVAKLLVEIAPRNQTEATMQQAWPARDSA